jgi:excisionase family DNA binding protein
VTTDDISRAVREALSLLTVDQVCELLQVDKQWLYKECQRGRFPHVKLNRQTRFRPADVQAYLDGTWRAPEPPVALEVVPTAPRKGRPRKQVS